MYGAYDLIECVYCDKEYLGTNMIALNSVANYEKEGFKIGTTNHRDSFKYSCIRCFNHLVIDNDVVYREKLELKKKILGEKNVKKRLYKDKQSNTLPSITTEER
jgi:hypothetical protein